MDNSAAFDHIVRSAGQKVSPSHRLPSRMIRRRQTIRGNEPPGGTMTSANQPHYEDSPPVTVQSAPTMPTAASAQYCSSSHNALRTLGFALLAAGTVSALAAIACYMYLNRGVYNPADAILLLVEGVAALACVPLLAAGVVTSVVAWKKRDK
ncbi:hypothetical protein [Bifidobacterium bifidum]